MILNLLAAVQPPGDGGISGPGQAGSIINPVLGGLKFTTGTSFFAKFIPGLVTLSFIIGVIIFLFILITGAIAWISSGGDKSALEAAKGKITNAIAGIVILFSVYAVLKLVEIFFGISILTLDLAPLIIQ